MQNPHIIDQARGLILDMDGVLWRDQTPIGDLPAIFAEIGRRGLQVSLVTNNATLSADQYVEKLARFGVPLNRFQIINSAQAAADYLHGLHPQGGPVYIVGEQGLERELAVHQFTISDDHPLAVLVALDRNVTYEKLKKASLLIRGGTPFIAVNIDKTYPTPEGLVPGAGTFVAAVAAASDVEPVVIGKPEPRMYQMALQRMSLQPVEVLVVGDRLETDITGAQQIGCKTALVLTGVSTPAQAAAWRPAVDCIVEDLSSLLDLK